MISEAIQETLEDIITNTYIAIGDEDIDLPFCVHTEREVPVRLKEGVVGYEYEAEIVIVDDSPDDVEDLKQSIISAIEALTGTTVESTSISSAEYLGDEPMFDQEAHEYATVLRFNIETNNR